jgi:nitrite reductase (NADH) large subunit
MNAEPWRIYSGKSRMKRGVRVKRFLKVSRWISIGTVALLAAGLARDAQWRGVRTVDLFWQGIVPLLPLVLLVAPHFWRRVCPVSVLNVVSARVRRGNREIGPPLFPARINVAIKRYGIMAAAALLWVLAPLRLLVFNPSAHATLVLIAALAATAVALGLAGPWKAAWCSSLCPVYPVEKLYGSAPVWQLADARCAPSQSSQSCFRCALHCVDVPDSDARYRAAMEKAGSIPSAAAMQRFFLGSFPAFVGAYWFLSASRASAAGTVYSTFLLFMLTSYAVFQLAHLIFARERRRVDLLVIAFTLNLYYAAASDRFCGVASSIMGWNTAQPVFRSCLLAFIFIVSAVWLRRAWNGPARPATRW